MINLQPAKPVELWAGIECTVNRVRDKYHDQLEFNGHAARDKDIEAFASLGITAIRYPLLWERLAPGSPKDIDWSWADRRMELLRRHRLRPIVGLVHHGSGPRHTDLTQPEFADGLAAYARAVAERFPWVLDYTPVNEPLTTARFSCLYGHWYPHACDAHAFGRAMIQQCRGTALAMRAIRQVQPEARLVQTEDLGKTHGTRRLSEQCAFENERRWLTADLLTGRLDPEGRLWRFLRAVGIPEADLRWFQDNPCPPDILGQNYYLTSERYLDHRCRSYAERSPGGNGRERYVDVEAVRALAEPAGLATLLTEAWERYGLPMAVTEVHLGCSREDQLRWLEETWQTACGLRAAGIDLRAITPWALLGSFDWNSLVTELRGHYEPGIFDLRSSSPRPTALAHWIRATATGGQSRHPLLADGGWWRRSDRFTWGAAARLKQRTNDRFGATDPPYGPPVLITGANGLFGRAFAEACRRRGISHQALARDELDIADPVSVAQAIERYQPWAVINTAGYTRIDRAESERQRCHRENTLGATVLAKTCGEREVTLVTFSTDMVFDGNKRVPYVEGDPVRPLNFFGHTKAIAERRVLARPMQALVIRTGACFAADEASDFGVRTFERLQNGLRITAPHDQVITATYLPDLVHVCLDLLIDGETGIWHLSNHGSLSWAQLALRAAEMSGADRRLVRRVPASELRLAAVRPEYSALGSIRGRLLPGVDSALERCVRQLHAQAGGRADSRPLAAGH